MAQRVLIGGGTGFVGQTLKEHLIRNGHKVTLISRTPGPDRVVWSELERNGIPEVDAVIQVPGANILAWPWTQSRKQELLDSRIKTTETLVKAIQSSSNPPKVFISGSAIGIYPVSTGEEFTEDSQKIANDFAGELVQKWEAASLPLSNSDKTRRVVTRFGVVVGNGGMLSPMMIPFKLGLGGKLGSGNQYMPWVHVKDIAKLHEHIITHPEIHGVLNAVAPEMVTNYEFTKTLGKVLNRPTILPVPEFAIKMMMGERAFLLLEGQKVVPKRTLESGFKFDFPDLESALRDVANS